MDCAICLNHIQRQQEAYLYPCCHFFCLQCIQEWTDRQRRHAHEEGPPGQQRCSYRCPLCKATYSYVVYECIGSSCRLIPTCGQPKTMSAMPLTADQSRRRALYVTPAQFTPARELPVAKRPRSPQDKETVKFVQRELQAVLLAEDVDIIVQHLSGVLQGLVKKNTAAPRPSQAATTSSSSGAAAMYGDRAAFLEHVAAALTGFLGEHSERFAQQLWCFLHAGLTLAVFDKAVFGEGTCEERAEEEQEQPAEGVGQMDDPVGAQDW